MRTAALLLFAVNALSAAELRVVVPTNAPAPVGPYSPGLAAGDYLYVSGQGARNAQNQFAATFEAQTEQCLENVKAIVEAGGMKMADVVYAQVYLSNMANYDAMNRVWAKWFPQNGPARAVLGVTRMPTETPVEITVVAAKPSVSRQQIGGSAQSPHAVRSGGRVYLSGILGRNADSNRLPEDPAAQVRMTAAHAKAVLREAKTNLGEATFLNVYVTDKVAVDAVEKELGKALGKSARAFIQVAALPMNVNVEITGVFAKSSDLSPVSATAGTTEEVLTKIRKELEARGLTMSHVAASNVYIDNLDSFAAMNKTYAGFFGTAPPTRTTVQALPPAAGRQTIISVIAVK